jgi:hypothetical protein
MGKLRQNPSNRGQERGTIIIFLKLNKDFDFTGNHTTM